MKSSDQEEMRVKSAPRVYNSTVRKKQADETRRSIADSADNLLKTKGYAGMTIEAIAQGAGVATQTVYAVFGSKRGILAELLDRAELNEDSLEAKPSQTAQPEELLRIVVRHCRQAYESESSTLDLLRGAGVVAPELALLEKQREARRYQALDCAIEQLKTSGRLKKGLSEAAVRDILWCQTSRDVYRMLAQERGWSAGQYEEWLCHCLGECLLA